MNFSSITFGCKVNQYETQLMREALGRFASVAGSDQSPDFLLVNTCSVTAEADRQARQALRRVRRRHPKSRILAAGCYARRDRSRLIEEGLADAFVPASDGESVLAAAGIDRGETEIPRTISRFDGHTRAFVKVQDGCDRCCSFCVVPSVRGRAVSRFAGEIESETRKLIEGGVPEIVICGIQLNAYRDPDSGMRLTGLLERLLELPGLGRLRISSIFPGTIEDRLISLLSGHPKMCRHAHLPVQSGSDRILKAMGRGYSSVEAVNLVRELRRGDPDMGVTADILVGYPGETDRDHEATVRLVEECEFDRMHLFPFSPRPGTRAAELPGVPPSAVQLRMDRLAAAGARLQAAGLERQVGRAVQIVVEAGLRGGFRKGLSGAYHAIWFGGGPAPVGSLANVRITGVVGGELQGAFLGDARG